MQRAGITNGCPIASSLNVTPPRTTPSCFGNSSSKGTYSATT